MNQSGRETINNFYKYQNNTKPSMIRLLFQFGNSDYQIIKNMPYSTQNYILNNASNIKTLGFDKFLSLVNNYGLYNIDQIFRKSSKEQLRSYSKDKVDNVISSVDAIMSNNLKNSIPICISDAPRIKSSFPDLFDSDLYKTNPELVEDIFYGKKINEYTLSKIISSGIDFSSIPLESYEEKIQKMASKLDFGAVTKEISVLDEKKIAAFLSLNFENEKSMTFFDNNDLTSLSRVLDCLPDTAISDYFYSYDNTKSAGINAWDTLTRKNEVSTSPESVKKVFNFLEVKSNPELVLNSPLYRGIPENLSDLVPMDYYDRMVDFSFQRNIDFDKFRMLFDYFDEETVSKIISGAKNGFYSDTNSFMYSDKVYGVDILSLITKGDYEKLTEVCKYAERKNSHLYNGIVLNNEWYKLAPGEPKLNGPYWISALSSRFSIEEAPYVLSKLGEFDKLEEYMKRLDYDPTTYSHTDILIGVTIAFGLLDNPDNKKIMDEWHKTMGREAFENIFANISTRLDPNLLKEIVEDYRNNQMYEHVGTHLPVYFRPNYVSTEDMVNRNIGYSNIPLILRDSIAKLKVKGFSEEYCRHYIERYELSIKKRGLSIPYISGETEKFAYDSIKLWDERLLTFDVDSGVNLPTNIKDKLFNDSNCRIIEIRDKNGGIVEQIYAQVDKEYNVTLSSLMGFNNVNVKQDMYGKIIEDMTAKYRSNGITPTFIIEEGISKLVEDSKELHLFSDPPKKTVIHDNTQEGIDKAEEIRIANLYKMSFTPVVSRDYANEALSRKGEVTTFYSGRDWFLKVYDYKEKDTEQQLKRIDFIGRYSKDFSTDGQHEMMQCLMENIEQSNVPISVGSYPTSYYTFAKLAAEGNIYILSDVKKVENGDGMHQTREPVGTVYDEENGIDYNKENVKNGFRFDFRGGNDHVGNELKFISPKLMTDSQKQKVEIQKRYYGLVVKHLEEERKLQKDSSSNRRWIKPEELESRYSELEQSLPGIKDVRVYSLDYLDYVLCHNNQYAHSTTYLPEYPFGVNIPRQR